MTKNKIMKRYKAIALFLFAITHFTAIAQPKAEWVAKSHNYGIINENDGDAKCTFTLINTGDSPLVITNARATCGCTRPKYSKEAIAPGDSMTISVSYDPVGRPGRFNKKIYIDTNTEPKRSTLEISGVVIANEQTIKSRFPVDGGELKLRTSVVPLGEVKKGKFKTCFLDAYNSSPDSITPQWENMPEYLSVMTAPKIVPPGEQATFTFYINTTKCSKWGFIEDSITLIPDKNSNHHIPVIVTTIIKEDFSKLTPGQRLNAPAIAVPDRVDFETIKHNNGIISKTFNIENFGKDELIIRRISTRDTGIEISIDKEKIKKGKSAIVSINVDTSKISDEIFNSRITIISNDPERSETTVRLVGEITK